MSASATANRRSARLAMKAADETAAIALLRAADLRYAIETIIAHSGPIPSSTAEITVMNDGRVIVKDSGITTRYTPVSDTE